jgi:hypothetical protein
LCAYCGDFVVSSSRRGSLNTSDTLLLIARIDGSGQLGIDDQRHAELLSELREIRHQTDSIPKKWELYLVAYVILGAVGAIFILRDIIVWLFLH